MAASNGTAAPGEPSPLTLPPLTVFGRFGQTVTLAGNDYKLRVFTTSGVLEIVQFIEDTKIQSVATDSGQPGDMLAEGAIAGRQTGLLQELFKRILVEDIPDDLVLRCAPDELGACLNLLFRTSGLTWLGNVLKNFGALRTQAIARAMLTPQPSPQPPPPAPTGTAPS